MNVIELDSSKTPTQGSCHQHLRQTAEITSTSAVDNDEEDEDDEHSCATAATSTASTTTTTTANSARHREGPRRLRAMSPPTRQSSSLGGDHDRSSTTPAADISLTSLNADRGKHMRLLSKVDRALKSGDKDGLVRMQQTLLQQKQVGCGFVLI